MKIVLAYSGGLDTSVIIKCNEVLAHVNVLEDER